MNTKTNTSLFRLVVAVLAMACGGPSSSSPSSQSSPSRRALASESRALDGVWIEVRRESSTERYEFYEGSRLVLSVDDTHIERSVTQRVLASGQNFVSWREPDGANRVRLFNREQTLAYGAGPSGSGSAIWRGEIVGFGLLEGGDFVAPEIGPASTAANEAWEDDAFFDGRTLSYTYENGKSFTNEFRGEHRFSMTTRRGLLDEVVVVRAVGGGVFLTSWIDTNMGHIAQVIDLSSGSVHAAVPLPGRSEIWRASITHSSDLAETVETSDR